MGHRGRRQDARHRRGEGQGAYSGPEGGHVREYLSSIDKEHSNGIKILLEKEVTPGTEVTQEFFDYIALISKICTQAYMDFALANKI